MGSKPGNRFTSVDDDIDDGTQATLLLCSSSSDSDYNGLSQVLSCSTEDKDSAGVSVSITSSNVTEGGVSATASVVLDSEPVSTVTVSLGVDTSDLALNKTTLTFNSANWDSAQSFTVQANDDSVYEGAENVLFGVGSASSDSLYSGLTTQTFDFSITDNESLPQISIADLSVSESDSSVLVSATVSVSPVSGDAITVGYSTQDDVALAGQDYQSAAGNVVIESGDSSATISLTVLGDNLVEADEDFALLLTSTSLGNFALGGDSALITILNDDASVSMGELSSSESVLSAALSSTTSLTCDFTDADFTQFSDYRVSLAVELQIIVQRISSVTGLRRRERVQRGEVLFYQSRALVNTALLTRGIQQSV